MADAGEALTVQRAAFVAEATLYDNTRIPPLTESLEALRGEIEKATVTVMGAFDGHRLVGSARLTVDRAGDAGVGPVAIGATIGWISRVAVAPDQQGRGIGARLLVALEAAAPAEVMVFKLWAGAESEANIRLYERLGYRFERDVVDTVGVKMVQLTKRLSG